MRSLKIAKKYRLKYRYNFEAPLVEAFLTSHKSLCEFSHETLNLNEYLNAIPDKTYLVKVVGNSMIDENIFDGDVLVVEKSDYAMNNNIVIASINGELLVKKLLINDNKIYLLSANKQFYPIEILNFHDFKIQGIVRHVIKNI